jgi:hypothetical protein
MRTTACRPTDTQAQLIEALSILEANTPAGSLARAGDTRAQ